MSVAHEHPVVRGAAMFHERVRRRMSGQEAGVVHHQEIAEEPKGVDLRVRVDASSEAEARESLAGWRAHCISIRSPTRACEQASPGRSVAESSRPDA
jgi:hypothetical protein